MQLQKASHEGKNQNVPKWSQRIRRNLFFTANSPWLFLMPYQIIRFA
jgi:hypothetical protein